MMKWKHAATYLLASVLSFTGAITTVAAEEIIEKDEIAVKDAGTEAPSAQEESTLNTYYSSETDGPKDYSVSPLEGKDGWFRINGSKVLYLYKQGTEGVLIGTDAAGGDTEKLYSAITGAGVEKLTVALTDMQSNMGSVLEAKGATVYYPGVTYADDNSGAKITIGDHTFESLAVKGHSKSGTVWIDKADNFVISGDTLGDGTMYLLDTGYALGSYETTTELQSMFRFKNGLIALNDAIDEETLILTNGKELGKAYTEDLFTGVEKIRNVDHETIHKYVHGGVGDDMTANYLTEEGSASIVWHHPGLGLWGYELQRTDFMRAGSPYLESEEYEERGRLGYDFYSVLYEDYGDGSALYCVKDTDIQTPWLIMNDKVALLIDVDMYGDLCDVLKPLVGDRDIYVYITHPHGDHYNNIGQFLSDDSELKKQIIANYAKQYESRTPDMMVYGGTNMEDTPGVTLGLDKQLKGVFMAEGGFDSASIVGVKLSDVFAEFESYGAKITLFKTGDLDSANDTSFSIGEGEYKMDFKAIYMQGHTAGDFILLDEKHRTIYSGDVLGTPACFGGYSMGAVPYPVALSYVNKLGDSYGDQFDNILTSHCPYYIPRSHLNNNKLLLESYVKYGKAVTLRGLGRNMVVWDGEINTDGLKDGMNIDYAANYHDTFVLYNSLNCAVSARTGKTNTQITAENLKLAVGQTKEKAFTSNNPEAPLEFTVEDESIISVDEEGNVTGLAEGTTSVKIFSPVTENYETAEKTVEVTVENPVFDVKETDIVHSDTDLKVDSLDELLFAPRNAYYEYYETERDRGMRITRLQANLYHIDEDTEKYPCSADNNGSSIYLVVGDEEVLMVDGGNGERGDIYFSNEAMDVFIKGIVGDKKLTAVISHSHGDHTGYFVDAASRETLGDIDVYIQEADYNSLNSAVKNNYNVKTFRFDEKIKLGPAEWDVYSLAAHTNGSHALVSREFNYIFTGDALGSGCAWVSNLVALKQTTEALVEKIGDMEDPIIYTAHRWQVTQGLAHSNNIAVQEVGMNYLKEMVSLIGHISQKNYEINDDYLRATATQKAIYTEDADLNTDGIYPSLFSSLSGINALIKEYFRFSDVEDPEKYYYEPVYWAFKNGITTGTSETEFSPESKVSRGQIVTFLYRAAGEPEVDTSKLPFTDVKAGAYYEKAVAWALENNITTGVSETEFAPDEKCTRAQIVTFLYRFAGEPEVEDIKLPFNDVKAGAFYETAVKWAYANDITTGTSATKFSPDGNCTRGQAVTFIYRVCAE